MAENDWLKKIPANPIRFNIRRSTHRFNIRSPDMNASIINYPDQKNSFLEPLPRRRLKSSFQPIVMGRVPKQREEETPTQERKTFRTTLRPNDIGAANMRRSVAPMRPVPQSTKPRSPLRKTSYFGPRKSQYIPVKPMASTTTRPTYVNPTSSRAVDVNRTPVVVLSAPSDTALRSILKQSQEKMSRLPIARSSTVKDFTAPESKVLTKPKAMKKVNFGSEKENEAGAAKKLKVAEEIADSDSPVLLTTDNLPPLLRSSLHIKPLTAPQPTNAELESEVQKMCDTYRERLNSAMNGVMTVWDEFSTELKTRFNLKVGALGHHNAATNTEEEMENKEDAEVTVRTPKVAKEPTPVRVRTPRTIRPPAKYLPDEISEKDTLRKVTDKGKAIKKKKETVMRGSAMKKRMKLSMAYKDLQKSFTLNSEDEFSEEEDADKTMTPNTVLNTPARKLQMSRRVRRQLKSLIS